MPNTSIKVCGQLFDAGTKVVLWDEPNGMSLYNNANGYRARNVSIEELRKQINHFYIHHAQSYTARSTYDALLAQNLSVIFCIDDDVGENGIATIRQFLDCKEIAFSQGADDQKINRNADGCGVEIAYMVDAWDHFDRYSEANQKKFKVQPHQIVSDKVHGMVLNNVFAPTEAQIKAIICLISAYKKAFPNLNLAFPRDANGKFISTAVPKDAKYGLLHHFNITHRKPDALGFPTDYVEETVNKMDKSRVSLIDKIFSFFKKK